MNEVITDFRNCS